MNGIYRATITAINGTGSGTVYLENGILKGGDGVFAYVGNYTIKGDRITADIKLIQHGQDFSVLGGASSLSFSGKIGNNIIEGVVTSTDSAAQGNITLSKIG
ncbi:hypothetical protein FACS189460_0520 [Deltaproteobacteria bacterium]|nr:hypothetical protein FACS189460_0520 [Deltaproteobacteria bacterium]